jgi:tetratricopeptide (TPR) repeat protein
MSTINEEQDHLAQIEAPKPPLDDFDFQDTLDRSQAFFIRYRKLIVGIGGGLLLAVLLVVGYLKWYRPMRNTEAMEASFRAEMYYRQDSLKQALNGDGKAAGFNQIADEYPGTKAGNLAHYYIGSILLRQGKFQEAIDQLDKFSSDDKMVSAMAIGMQADAYLELNKMDDALAYYRKAADRSKNQFTTPMYWKRAALVCQLQKNYTEAISYFKKIKSDYPNSQEGADADKYIAMYELQAGPAK